MRMASSVALGCVITLLVWTLPAPSAAAPSDAPGSESNRLAGERTRLSEAAASTGNDPTAIVGFYQLGYGHSAFTSGLDVDTATAIVRLPVTPNFFFQATMPYLWADPPGAATVDGAGDMTVRVGGRLYASDYAALFLGADASFPTASETQLGTGKYTIGPGGGLAVPLPRVRSLLYLLVLNYISVVGDPARADVHYMQVQSVVNTILSDRWWSLVQGSWATNWENHRKTSLNLTGQIGYQVDRHWGVFAGAGGGVVEKDAFLSLDWTVQAGVRWVFRTPLFSKRVFGE